MLPDDFSAFKEQLHQSFRQNLPDSYTPMKQIVGNGISVFSIDFEQMGKRDSEFVKNKLPIEVILPTFLTLRGSI